MSDTAKPKGQPRNFGSFRPRPEDVHAARRSQGLLELSSAAQVLRVALQHLLRTLDACETPEAAQALLAPLVRDARTVKSGPAAKGKRRSVVTESAENLTVA